MLCNNVNITFESKISFETKLHGEEAIFFLKKDFSRKVLLFRTMFTKKRGEFFETATVEKNDTA